MLSQYEDPDVATWLGIRLAYHPAPNWPDPIPVVKNRTIGP